MNRESSQPSAAECRPTAAPTAPVSLVVGAGPAGIATAVYLARHGHEVHVFDRRPSPLAADSSDDGRAFVVVLNARGAAALAGAGFDVPALASAPGSALQRVAALGLGGGAALQRRRIAFDTPRLVGSRHAFVRQLVEQAQGMGLPHLHWHWEAAFEGADLHARTATFASVAPAPADSDASSASSASGSNDSSDEGSRPVVAAAAQAWRYDLLVAADGGRSRVRAAAQAQLPELQVEAEAARLSYKVFAGLPPSPEAPFGLDHRSVDQHSADLAAGGSTQQAGNSGSAEAQGGVQLRALVAAGGGRYGARAGAMFLSADPTTGAARGIVSMLDAAGWQGLDSPASCAAFLGEQFPALPASWRPLLAEQLAANAHWAAGTRVRASQLHGPSLLLVGDAGHGVTPRTGNGMNAALEDAAVVAQLLERSGGDLRALPAAFTAARLRDAHALLWLDGTAAARSGTSAWGALHPAAVAAGVSMLGRAALHTASGGWVEQAAVNLMNDGCCPYSAVQAQIRRDAALLATVGLPLLAAGYLAAAAATAAGRLGAAKAWRRAAA